VASLALINSFRVIAAGESCSTGIPVVPFRFAMLTAAMTARGVTNTVFRQICFRA
jgi:hypothetical protein